MTEYVQVQMTGCVHFSDHQTKPIFKLGQEIDESKANMKGRNQAINDLDLVSTRG